MVEFEYLQIKREDIPKLKEVSEMFGNIKFASWDSIYGEYIEHLFVTHGNILWLRFNFEDHYVTFTTSEPDKYITVDELINPVNVSIKEDEFVSLFAE